MNAIGIICEYNPFHLGHARMLEGLRRQYDAAKDDGERENVTRAVRFGLAALDHRDIL